MADCLKAQSDAKTADPNASFPCDSMELARTHLNKNVKLKRLSGGTLQRAGVAYAIAGHPRVVLLDEPTVGLDPEQRLVLRKVLRDLAKEACVPLSGKELEMPISR